MNDKLYLVGTNGRDLRILDVSKKTWNTLASGSVDRLGFMVYSVGDSLHVLGGDTISMSKISVFNVGSGKWEEKSTTGPVPMPRIDFGGVVCMSFTPFVLVSVCIVFYSYYFCAS